MAGKAQGGSHQPNSALRFVGLQLKKLEVIEVKVFPRAKHLASDKQYQQADEIIQQQMHLPSQVEIFAPQKLMAENKGKLTVS